MEAIEMWRLRRPSWFADTVINFAPEEGAGWSGIVDELLQQIDSTFSMRPMPAICIGQIEDKVGSRASISDST